MQDNRTGSPSKYSASGYSQYSQQPKNLESSKPHITSQYRLSESEGYQNYNHNPFSNLTYFQTLKVMLKQNRLFFFHQFLTGNFIKQVFRRFGLGCFCAKQNDNTDFLESSFLSLYDKITPQCLPNMLRPFLCGLFIPMLVLFYLNYEYLKNDFNVHWVVFKVLDIFFVVMIVMFIVIGFSTGGNLKTDIWRYRSASICNEKPWIKTEQTFCVDCRIIKPIRSYHCKYCQLCSPKYTKHSIVFNQCIGAQNQLLYMIFQGLFFILITLILALFISPKQPLFHSFKVFIIRFVFFIINSYLQGMSGFEFLRGVLYTINYNCTQYQVSNWSFKPYLCTFERTRFYNPFESTVTKHIVGSVYGFFGCSDDNDSGNRIQNWAKTYYYYPSHIRGHAESMQWILYYQQLQQKQKQRHQKLMKQLQILTKLENVRARGRLSQELEELNNNDNFQIEQQIEKQQNKINVDDKVKRKLSRGLSSDDDIHSITENDCRRAKILLVEEKVNNSTM